MDAKTRIILWLVLWNSFMPDCFCNRPEIPEVIYERPKPYQYKVIHRRPQLDYDPRPLTAIRGPTVNVFDPIPNQLATKLRNPIVSGVLEQHGILAYTPFFSQAFLLDFIILALFTFITLIPAGFLLAANQFNNRYNALKAAAEAPLKNPPSG